MNGLREVIIKLIDRKEEGVQASSLYGVIMEVQNAWEGCRRFEWKRLRFEGVK